MQGKRTTGSPRTTIMDVLAQLDRSGGAEACWEWTGYRLNGTYGQVSVSGRNTLVHRFVAEHLLGDVAGLVVRHSCDNPPCANPRHLLIGTQAENVKDMIDRGRKFTKLSGEQVGEIRAALAAGATQRPLAERYGISQTTVFRIGKGRR